VSLQVLLLSIALYSIRLHEEKLKSRFGTAHCGASAASWGGTHSWVGGAAPQKGSKSWGLCSKPIQDITNYLIFLKGSSIQLLMGSYQHTSSLVQVN